MDGHERDSLHMDRKRRVLACRKRKERGSLLIEERYSLHIQYKGTRKAYIWKEKYEYIPHMEETDRRR